MKNTHHAYDAARQQTACGVSLDSTSNTTKDASGPQLGWHRHRKYHLAYSFLAGEKRFEFEVTCKACLRRSQP